MAAIRRGKGDVLRIPPSISSSPNTSDQAQEGSGGGGSKAQAEVTGAGTNTGPKTGVSSPPQGGGAGGGSSTSSESLDLLSQRCVSRIDYNTGHSSLTFLTAEVGLVFIFL